MIFRAFAATGVSLPVVGQGTWKLGEVPGQAESEINALQEGFDLGMTHVDTAELYGNGTTEELVGRAIAGRREALFVTSKVLPSNASYEGTLRACERSLRRLGTDRIDLYLLHWWSDEHPLEETIRAMEELVVSGKIRFWGVSNFDTEQLKRASSAGPVTCDQVAYHLKARGIEFSLIPWCEQRRIAVVGYSPFGSGNFPKPDSRQGRILGEIGRRHRKTARQVAINFLTRKDGLFTIPKASSPEHVRENAEAVGWQLSAEDLAAIDQVFPPPISEIPLEII